MSEAAKTVIYIGDDRNYYGELKIRFSRIYNTKFEFFEIDTEYYEVFQNIYARLFDIRPDLIYLDCSKNLDENINLAKLLSREYFFRDKPITALVENHKDARKMSVTGVDFVHVKSGEYHDIVYDAMFVRYPKEVVKPDFAIASLEKEVILKEYLRVGYITPTSIHAEGDIKFEKGQVIELESKIPDNVIPSKKFIVSSISSQDLYFNHKYSYDLDFVFVDKPELDTSAEDQEAEQKKFDLEFVEYEERLRRAKKANKSWVSDNMSGSVPKKTKILIVDKSISVLKSSKNLDAYPFLIRCQTYLSEKLGEIHRFRPSLFVFQLPEYIAPEPKEEDVVNDSEEEAVSTEAVKSDEDTESEENIVYAFHKRIKELIDEVKKIENYKPFVLVYNCHDKTTLELQHDLDYPLSIATSDMLSIENVVELAEIYEKKQNHKYKTALDSKYKQLKLSDPVKFRTLQVSDLEEKRYYIKQSNNLSFVFIKHPVTLLSVSESEMDILAPNEMKQGTYSIEYPESMAATIVPVDGKLGNPQGGGYLYHLLLNGYEEKTKKSLRKIVNDIYTREAQEKALLEKEEFDKLNEEAKLKVQGNKVEDAEKAKVAEENAKHGIVISTSDDVIKEADDKDSGGFEKK